LEAINQRVLTGHPKVEKQNMLKVFGREKIKGRKLSTKNQLRSPMSEGGEP